MKKEPELSFTTSFLLIGTALFFDLIQFTIGFIPIVGQIFGWLVSFFAGLTFWFWFKTQGITFSKKGRGLTLVGGAVIEMIPLINMLPAWTLAVVRIIISTRTNKIISNVTSGSKQPENTPQSSPQKTPAE